MKIVTGKVVDGKIEVKGRPLVEGTEVTVVLPDTEEVYHLSTEEEAALLESIAEADRGEVRPMKDVLRDLRRRRRR